MTTLAAFLLSMVGSLAARVLLSLGIGVFSYAALTTLASSVAGSITTAYSGLGGSVLSILNLAGVGQLFGILIAAMITRASITAIKALRPV